MKPDFNQWLKDTLGSHPRRRHSTCLTMRARATILFFLRQTCRDLAVRRAHMRERRQHYPNDPVIYKYMTGQIEHCEAVISAMQHVVRDHLGRVWNPIEQPSSIEFFKLLDDLSTKIPHTVEIDPCPDDYPLAPTAPSPSSASLASAPAALPSQG